MNVNVKFQLVCDSSYFVLGVRLNSLLGRKGSMEKMNNYWDVGQFFTVSMLANDVPKATQAAEKLFKLKPPLW